MTLPKVDRGHPLASALDARLAMLDPTERYYLTLRLAHAHRVEALAIISEIETLGGVSQAIFPPGNEG